LMEIVLNLCLAFGMILFVGITGLNRFGVQLVAWYYPFVLLGYYCHLVERYFLGCNRYRIVAVMIVTWIVFLIGLLYWRWKANIVLPTGITLCGSLANMYCMVLSIIGCVGWLLCCWAYPTSSLFVHNCVVRLGQMTLGIYALHQQILTELNVVTLVKPMCVVVLFFSALSISVALVLLIRLSPTLAFLLLGERRGKLAQGISR